MTALAWSFAAITFLLWLIEHRGGADSRARLRRQRDDAETRACELGLRLLVAEHERDRARALLHPSQRLRVVREGDR